MSSPVSRVLIALSMVGCVPFADPLASDPNAGKVDMETVVAPVGFDFSTSKVVRASVHLRLAGGEAAGSVPVTLYDAPPADGGNELAAGMTAADGTYAADVSVRTSADRLVAVAGYPGTVSPIALPIVNHEASAQVAGMTPGFSATDEWVDTDGDGVSDDVDAATNDPAVAFESHAPARHVMSTIAFEDSWPAASDHDFNDLVVDYNVRLRMNASNLVTSMIVSFELRAAGAGQRNAFGFSLPIAAGAVASVAGRRIHSGLFPSLPNGVEARQRRAVIIVTDDVYKELPRPSGYFVNTQNEAPVVPTEMIMIVVKFRVPIASAALGAAPFDPFLIVNRIRGREVHLADQPPTDLADVSLFGTGSDDSRPATGRYYRTRNNLPSALALPTIWDYPRERAQVTKAHLHFSAWVTSGGAAFPDWYDASSGSRAPTQLYGKR